MMGPRRPVLTDGDCRRAHRDGIRRTRFGDEIALPGGRRPANAHGRAACDHCAAGMWLQAVH